MPVKRRTPKTRNTGLTDLQRRLLRDELSDAFGDTRELYLQRLDRPEAGAALWRDYGAAIVAEWAVEHPGTRPSLWWRHEAPELRRRVGGVGTACHDRLAHAASYRLGVPIHWITDRLAAALERTSRKPLGVPAVDPDDPPTFESQAAYLKRLGLLLPGEAKRLRPADFEPQAIGVEA